MEQHPAAMEVWDIVRLGSGKDLATNELLTLTVDMANFQTTSHNTKLSLQKMWIVFHVQMCKLETGNN